jgi:hypothetical protein
MSDITVTFLHDLPSKHLLKVLNKIWCQQNFDEINISTEAPYNLQLLAALDFLDPQISRRFRHGLALTRASERRIEDWLQNMSGRSIDGLQLIRYGIGWCEIRGAQ